MNWQIKPCLSLAGLLFVSFVASPAAQVLHFVPIPHCSSGKQLVHFVVPVAPALLPQQTMIGVKFF